MNKVQITHEGKLYNRISKQAAHKLYNKGQVIVTCPHKMHPFALNNAFSMPIARWDKDGVGDTRAFDDYISHITWYNCTYETGYYPAFYLEVQA